MTSKVAAFRRTVWEHWKKNGRHSLPWRKTRDPYKILVSEVMLQQTQVPRVLPKYKEFLKEFPTVKALAKAQLADVLKIWSGLGYNRRAKFLHEAAKEITVKYDGEVPPLYSELVELPGIGDYTGKAVCVFAFNQPHILIETNIRTAFLHHFCQGPTSASRFCQGRTSVSDEELLRYIVVASKGEDPREWNWALMDYGAYLKASGVRLNARSKHYTKQSKFEGSLRQVRGAILKAVTRGDSIEEVREQYQKQFASAFNSLRKEGLIV